MQGIIGKHVDVVEQVLERYPKTRDDDFLLYAAVCREYGFDIKNTSIVDWAKNHKQEKWPAFTSINRARLLVEEKRPDLISDMKRKRLEKQGKIVDEVISM